MSKALCLGLFLCFRVALASAETGLALVFDGVNGYPTEHTKYRIEVFVDSFGLVSEIRAYSEGSAAIEERTKIYSDKRKGRVTGVCESETSRTTFTFEPGERSIKRRVTVYDTVKEAVFSDVESSVLIEPRPGVVFETDTRMFIKPPKGELQIVDKALGKSIYVFDKNDVVNEGWFKADWKTVGNKTTIHEFVTMEQYSEEWVDCGSGVYTVDDFPIVDLRTSVLNFCILDAVYRNNPDFIPFLFGLKTGSY